MLGTLWLTEDNSACIPISMRLVEGVQGGERLSIMA